jgi:hypothetical protein
MMDQLYSNSLVLGRTKTGYLIPITKPLKPSYLLPHENKELKLMLADEKPLALFSAENG